MDKGRVPTTRHFLGWDAPLAQKVCDYLLTGRGSRPVDLSALLVVVPTRQSGRRLREALARRCAELETGLLAPHVVAPGDLFSTSRSGPAAAPRALVSAVWTNVLRRAKLADFAPLFPAEPPAQDFAWASHLASVIIRLREDLAEAGLTIGAALQSRGHDLPEFERWESLARLETLYRKALERLRRADPCDSRIAAAAAPAVPDGVERVIVAGVSDLPPIAAQALEALARTMPVDLLLHAPAGESARFDAWGRPLAETWAKADIPIADAEENILLGGSPSGQSRAVLEVLDREADAFGLDQTAIGVPDPDVTPFLSAALAARGLKNYDPAGRPLREHPLFQFLDAARRLLSEGDYAAFAAFTRHTDVLACLDRGEQVLPVRVLVELDDFQNEFLPVDFDDVLARLGAHARDRKFPALFQAARLAARIRERFRDAAAPDALRWTLQQVYALRQVRPAEPRDEQFLGIARQVTDAMDELDAESVTALNLKGSEALELLVERLRDERYYPDAGDASIDLEGWLELPWNVAPLLVITGMNEGLVPAGRCADVFLPDSLRRELGLRHEAERCARDAFLLRGLAEARRADGRLVLLAGRTSSTGDPLRPSRLLFRCDDETLLARCAALFGEPKEPRPQHPATISFKLDPRVPEAAPLKVMHVTMFRSYLACPFRFYLRYALGMESVDDRKSELDALDFGTLMHVALQRLIHVPPESGRDEEGVAGFLAAAVDERVRERFGDDPPLQILVQREAARQRLRAAARCHAQTLAEGWELIAVERSFSARFGDVEVRGKVDRMERHRNTGAVRLLDYKTSDRGVEPAAAHLARERQDTEPYARVSVEGEPRRWVDLQLPLYRHLVAAEKEFQRAPGLQIGYFNLPKAVTESGLAMWEPFDDALFASARLCAEGVIADLARRRFWPPRDRVAYDEFEILFPGPPAECFVEIK